MILHIGFEQPTPEIMERWGKWLSRGYGMIGWGTNARRTILQKIVRS